MIELSLIEIGSRNLIPNYNIVLHLFGILFFFFPTPCHILLTCIILDRFSEAILIIMANLGESFILYTCNVDINQLWFLFILVGKRIDIFF